MLPGVNKTNPMNQTRTSGFGNKFSPAMGKTGTNFMNKIRGSNGANYQTSEPANNSRIGTTTSDTSHLFSQLVSQQRKTPNATNNQMMMTTNFFNNTQNFHQPKFGSTQASAAISKTIAQAKLRKQRQQRGSSNPISGEQADYLNSAIHNRQQSQVTPGGFNPS